MTLSLIRSKFLALLPCVVGGVLSLFGATACRAESVPDVAGEYQSPDRCFRLVAFPQSHGTGILFYGCITIESVRYHYVSEAQDVRHQQGVIVFTLPPRRLSNLQNTTPGIAGHQSEMPAQPIHDIATTWRLRFSASSVVLECTSTDKLACGVRSAVELTHHP